MRLGGEYAHKTQKGFRGLVAEGALVEQCSRIGTHGGESGCQPRVEPTFQTMVRLAFFFRRCLLAYEHRNRYPLARSCSLFYMYDI
jgi:hypothetical protein